MSAHVVGIDIGTHSTKGVLVTAVGDVLEVAEVPHPVSLPALGHVEHDGESVWWGDTRRVLQQLAVAVPDGGTLDAVGLSSCGPCVVPVGADDRPLRPGILYGIDTRAVDEIADLAAEWPDELAVERFGMPFSSQSAVPKRRWVARHEPDVDAAATGWLTATGFVGLRLTGQRVLDHHQAGYFAPDYEGGAWRDEGDALPRLVWSDEVVGAVTPEAASATGVAVGTPVIAGSSDGATDPVGAGIGGAEPGTALLRYGSTLGITLVSGDAAGAGVRGLWRTPGNREGEAMYVAGLSTAGSATTWFRDQLAQDLPHGDAAEVSAAHRALVAEAAASKPGAGGLLALPYLAGERTPFTDPHARGVIAGIGLQTTRGDLYRAILEGAAFGLRQIVEAAHAGGLRIERFRSVGGGTLGGLWPQIVSDVTGIPQQLVEPHLGAPLGAARLAAEGIGLVARTAAPWVRVSGDIVPNPANRALYDERYPLFRELYSSTRDIVVALGTGGRT